MKVRSDFVSNSSSCSFIIDAQHVIAVQQCVSIKLHGLVVPYDIDNDIKVYLYAKNKNVDKLIKQLIELDYIGDVYSSCKYDEANAEEVSYDNSICISIGQFIDLMWKTDAEFCALIEQIIFDSDDYGTGPMNLKDFYDFFERNHCYPNAENSEHEFIDSTRSKFKDILKGIS